MQLQGVRRVKEICNPRIEGANMQERTIKFQQNKTDDVIKNKIPVTFSRYL